jgi:hypothetical protein
MAWEVRLASNVVGIFHPKLIVGGEAFLATGAIRRPSFLYVGSANLTAPALSVNTECGALISGADVPIDASATFEKLWAMASAVTPSLLASYTEAFTRRNRSRRADDLVDFGVTDPAEVPPTLATLRLKRKPRHAALPHDSAQTVWIGLESSTGAYSFQPEFPRRSATWSSVLLSRRGVDAIPPAARQSASHCRGPGPLQRRCHSSDDIHLLWKQLNVAPQHPPWTFLMRLWRRRIGKALQSYRWIRSVVPTCH